MSKIQFIFIVYYINLIKKNIFFWEKIFGRNWVRVLELGLGLRFDGVNINPDPNSRTLTQLRLRFCPRKKKYFKIKLSKIKS